MLKRLLRLLPGFSENASMMSNTDMETDEQFRVHAVEGQMVVLAEPGQAAAAIERAAR